MSKSTKKPKMEGALTLPVSKIGNEAMQGVLTQKVFLPDGKYCIITDLHGVPEALEAIVEHCKHNGCQNIIFLGDLFGGGPDLKDTIALLQRLCSREGIDGVSILIGVQGNHDAYFPLDANTFSFQSLSGKPACSSVNRLLGQISDDAKAKEFLKAYLAFTPYLVELSTRSGQSILLTHYLFPFGKRSIDKERPDILYANSSTAYRPKDLWEVAPPNVAAIFLGHKHSTSVSQHKGRYLINPGSASGIGDRLVRSGKNGKVKAKCANFVVFELDGSIKNIEAKQVPYSATALRKRIRKAHNGERRGASRARSMNARFGV